MHQKPLSYLNNAELADPAKAEAVMDRLLLYACYPGAASVPQMNAQRSLYRAYIPLYNALGAPAGSRSHTRASSPPDAWCERFGTAPRLFLRHPQSRRRPRSDPPPGHESSRNLRKRHFRRSPAAKSKVLNAASVHLAIPARWTAVVAVNRADAGALAETNRHEKHRFGCRAHSKQPLLKGTHS